MIDTEHFVFLDHHATTPCDPRVIEAMLPFFGVRFANPSSETHRAGRVAAIAVADAREKVADLIGASPGEILFTGSATESNNLAILGLVRASGSSRRKILTSAVEHKSVLDPVRSLGRGGFQVQEIGVDRLGRLDHDEYREALDDDTLLVSVQAANNEIGTLQAVSDIAELAHSKGAMVHCDAVQAVGRIPVDMMTWDVDLMSLNAHKLYGPKGIGALYIRGGRQALPLLPLMFGGGQEDGLRPGTLNVPAIVGFGEACRLASEVLPAEASRISTLRDRFESRLLDQYKSVRRNGALDCRLPGNTSLTFPGIDADALIARLPELALSTGSACTSGSPDPSHVLRALGLTRAEAYQTLRIGVGRYTTADQVDTAANQIVDALTAIEALLD